MSDIDKSRAAFEAQAIPDVGFGFTRNSHRPDDYAGLYLQGQWVGYSSRQPELAALREEVERLNFDRDSLLIAADRSRDTIHQLREQLTRLKAERVGLSETPIDKTPFLPTTPEAALSRIAEECSEVIKVVCKAQRFGILDVHPKKGKTNLVLLGEEFEDIKQAMADYYRLSAQQSKATGEE